MKVAKKVIYITLILWSFLLVTSYAATGTITTEGARIRREPNTSSEVLTIAYSGETVEIIEKSGDWYKVKYQESTGYIRGDLMKITGEVEEQTPTEEQPSEEPVAPNQEEKPQEEPQEDPQEEALQPEQTEVQEESFQEVEKQVVANTVIRIVPNLSASVIGEIKEKTKVTVIQIINAWSCIQYENQTAWLPSIFLGEVTQEPEPEKPATRTGYVNVAGAIIRRGPSTSAEIITEWARNKPVEIVGEEGDWYKLNFNGEEAYVAKRLISNTTTSTSRNGQEERQAVEENKNEANDTTPPVEQATVTNQEPEIIKTVYVNVAIANLRKEGSTSCEIVGKALRNASLQVIGEENGWYQLKTENGIAYILKTLTVDTIEEVVVPQEPVVTEVVQETTEISSSTGEAVVALAKQYLGARYVYGGEGPQTFDCSGFTKYIYQQFGISLTHSALAQANSGMYVEKASLQLGDLVIFKDWDNTSIGHCGIYIGGGRFIHAANSTRGVVSDTLNSGYYYERYVSGRRLF